MQACVLPQKELKNDIGSPKRVCFVCTGNTCRSPMAAALYNHLFAHTGKIATSAGIFAREGDPIHPHAEQALRLYGIPCTPQNNYAAHTARQLCKEDMEQSDAVYALTPSHAMLILQRFPEFASKIATLADISDPFGGDLEDYQKTLDAISEALL